MARYIAFLRAINVGGHVVTMERLRLSFLEMGLANVETFIASGNVIFESRAQPDLLEIKIEKQLQKELGYEVVTFVRSDAELAQVAKHKAFAESGPGTEGTLFIGFLRSEPTLVTQEKLLACRSAVDDFHFHQRELYWLCRTRSSDSQFSGPRLEKVLGRRTTIRNANTVRRLVSKYPV